MDLADRRTSSHPVTKLIDKRLRLVALREDNKDNYDALLDKMAILQQKIKSTRCEFVSCELLEEQVG